MNEEEIASIYTRVLEKSQVDLRLDIDSSVAIHILIKPEKNKLEKTFIKNAIKGLQLFDKHKHLLNTEGFGSHLFS